MSITIDIKSIINGFKRGFKQGEYVDTVASTDDTNDPIIMPPFVSFPCECGVSLEVEEAILPGQAAVLSCYNCEISWTVYNPSLVIKKTKEVPEQVQEVWRELSQ